MILSQEIAREELQPPPLQVRDQTIGRTAFVGGLNFAPVTPERLHSTDTDASMAFVGD